MLQRNLLAAHEFMLPPLQTVGYGFDWRKRLAGQKILLSQFSTEGGDVEIYGDTIFEDGQVTAIYVSGGHPGKFYRLTNYVETATEQHSETITLSCHFDGVIPQMAVFSV